MSKTVAGALPYPDFAAIAAWFPRNPRMAPDPRHESFEPHAPAEIGVCDGRPSRANYAAMADKPDSRDGKAPATRKDRLAVELRANLLKRKAQSRARRQNDSGRVNDRPVDDDTRPGKAEEGKAG
jgi:hypothetical protein